jgi:hypothetical protein
MCAERMEKSSITPTYSDELALLEENFLLDFLKKRGLTLSKLRLLPRQTAKETIEKASLEFLRSLPSTNKNYHPNKQGSK